MNRKDQPSNPHRRQFFAAVSAVACAGAVANIVTTVAQAADAAPALPLLSEGDSLAVSMGYKADTTKVDPKKYATHKPTQTCANCQFYQGAANAAQGPCQIFAGKSVTAKGWCQVWAQKK